LMAVSPPPGLFDVTGMADWVGLPEPAGSPHPVVRLKPGIIEREC
jgi:hypothetical protein